MKRLSELNTQQSVLIGKAQSTDVYQQLQEQRQTQKAAKDNVNKTNVPTRSLNKGIHPTTADGVGSLCKNVEASKTTALPSVKREVKFEAPTVTSSTGQKYVMVGAEGPAKDSKSTPD